MQVFGPINFAKIWLQGDFNVIRFDQRDTGLSTWVDFNKNPYTLLDMVEDVCELLDALTIQKAHIVGFSTGGTIAQLLAKNHPDRVSSLTLLMPSMDITIKNDAFVGKDMSKAAFPHLHKNLYMQF